MMKKDDQAARRSCSPSTHEMLEVATTVAPTDLEIPAGFKEKK